MLLDRRIPWTFLALAFLMARTFTVSGQETEPSTPQTVQLQSFAMLVHNLDEMVAFYSEAFDSEFEPREIQGVNCWFGQVGGLTLKLVPLRQGVDFENFPLQQPGFRVPSVEAVIEIALRHGGRQEGEIRRDKGEVHGAVRDPDGNTIELYSVE